MNEEKITFAMLKMAPSMIYGVKHSTNARGMAIPFLLGPSLWMLCKRIFNLSSTMMINASNEISYAFIRTKLFMITPTHFIL